MYGGRAGLVYEVGRSVLLLIYIYICILTMSFNHLIKYGGLSKKSVRRQDSMA